MQEKETIPSAPVTGERFLYSESERMVCGLDHYWRRGHVSNHS